MPLEPQTQTEKLTSEADSDMAPPNRVRKKKSNRRRACYQKVPVKQGETPEAAVAAQKTLGKNKSKGSEVTFSDMVLAEEWHVEPLEMFKRIKGLEGEVTWYDVVLAEECGDLYLSTRAPLRPEPDMTLLECMSDFRPEPCMASVKQRPDMESLKSESDMAPQRPENDTSPLKTEHDTAPLTQEKDKAPLTPEPDMVALRLHPETATLRPEPDMAKLETMRKRKSKRSRDTWYRKVLAEEREQLELEQERTPLRTTREGRSRKSRDMDHREVLPKECEESYVAPWGRKLTVETLEKEPQTRLLETETKVPPLKTETTVGHQETETAPQDPEPAPSPFETDCDTVSSLQTNSDTEPQEIEPSIARLESKAIIGHPETVMKDNKKTGGPWFKRVIEEPEPEDLQVLLPDSEPLTEMFERETKWGKKVEPDPSEISQQEHGNLKVPPKVSSLKEALEAETSRCGQVETRVENICPLSIQTDVSMFEKHSKYQDVGDKRDPRIKSWVEKALVQANLVLQKQKCQWEKEKSLLLARQAEETSSLLASLQQSQQDLVFQRHQWQEEKVCLLGSLTDILKTLKEKKKTSTNLMDKLDQMEKKIEERPKELEKISLWRRLFN